MKFLIAVFCLAVFVGACTSPETKRARGEGAGADIGNRGKVVQMHEGSDPYYKTPQIIGTQHAAVESASQANRLSRK